MKTISFSRVELMSKQLLIASLALTGFILPLTVSAQEAAPPAPVATPETAPAATSKPAATPAKKEDSKLKPGVVASYGKFDKGAAVDGAANGNIAGEQQSPVAGSVRFVSGDRCEATVTNLSEKDSYAVSFDVVGSRGSSRAFSRGYSASLKPKGSVVRSVSGCASDLNVQVVLKSGRKVGN